MAEGVQKIETKVAIGFHPGTHTFHVVLKVNDTARAICAAAPPGAGWEYPTLSEVFDPAEEVDPDAFCPICFIHLFHPQGFRECLIYAPFSRG